MALKAVVFDVSETLFDETGIWERAADAAAAPRFTVMGILGGLAARGERHSKVWELLEIAYVGDRVDNDVEPALAAGIDAVHVRRGPWGHLHDPPAEAISVQSLGELPGALGV